MPRVHRDGSRRASGAPRPSTSAPGRSRSATMVAGSTARRNCSRWPAPARSVRRGSAECAMSSRTNDTMSCGPRHRSCRLQPWRRRCGAARVDQLAKLVVPPREMNGRARRGRPSAGLVGIFDFDNVSPACPDGGDAENERPCPLKWHHRVGPCATPGSCRPARWPAVSRLRSARGSDCDQPPRGGRAPRGRWRSGLYPRGGGENQDVVLARGRPSRHCTRVRSQLDAVLLAGAAHELPIARAGEPAERRAGVDRVV